MRLESKHTEREREMTDLALQRDGAGASVNVRDEDQGSLPVTVVRTTTTTTSSATATSSAAAAAAVAGAEPLAPTYERYIVRRLVAGVGVVVGICGAVAFATNFHHRWQVCPLCVCECVCASV